MSEGEGPTTNDPLNECRSARIDEEEEEEESLADCRLSSDCDEARPVRGEAAAEGAREEEREREEEEAKMDAAGSTVTEAELSSTCLVLASLSVCTSAEHRIASPLHTTYNHTQTSTTNEEDSEV